MTTWGIGIENPLQRLYTVRLRMRELKGSRTQPIIALGSSAPPDTVPRPCRTSIRFTS